MHRKAELTERETGIFVYHKGRMTRALEKLKLQAAQTNAGSTSTIRVEVRLTFLHFYK